jgi:hypothetical protein
LACYEVTFNFDFCIETIYIFWTVLSVDDHQKSSHWIHMQCLLFWLSVTTTTTTNISTTAAAAAAAWWSSSQSSQICQVICLLQTCLELSCTHYRYLEFTPNLIDLH